MIEVKLKLNTHLKLGSPIQNPSLTTVYRTHHRIYQHDVISGFQEIINIPKTVHARGKVTIKHTYGVAVANSESVIETCIQRSLAELS